MAGMAATLLLVSACASTNPLNMNSISNQGLDDWTEVTVSNPEAKVLRDKIVVAIIGHYAANRIQKWSGDNAEGDADRVLGALVNLEKKLAAARASADTSIFEQYNHVKYLASVGKAIRAAAQPAKRRYRSVLLSLIDIPSPMAAAKNFAQALVALGEIAVYEEALKEDLKTLFGKIEKRGGAPTPAEWKGVDQFFYDACKRLVRFSSGDDNPCTKPT